MTYRDGTSVMKCPPGYGSCVAVHISGIPQEISENDFLHKLWEFGPLVGTMLRREADLRPEGTGIFQYRDDAERCRRELNETRVMNRELWTCKSDRELVLDPNHNAAAACNRTVGNRISPSGNWNEIAPQEIRLDAPWCSTEPKETDLAQIQYKERWREHVHGRQ